MNASSLMVVVDGEHWLGWAWLETCSGQSGVHFTFQLTPHTSVLSPDIRCVYGALCWSVANWKSAAAGVLDNKLADFSFQVEYFVFGGEINRS